MSQVYIGDHQLSRNGRYNSFKPRLLDTGQQSVKNVLENHIICQTIAFKGF